MENSIPTNAASADMLRVIEQQTKRLLPLLALLEMPEEDDGIRQLLKLLNLILDGQEQLTLGLKSVDAKLERLSRR